MEPLVVLDRVNKHFGELHVLKDITTTIAKGEVVVVIGPSGSGKSTLCRAINRLETIDSGTITIDGSPLPEEGNDLARLRADVGMVFQSFNLFAHKTVLENVTLGPIRVRKKSKAEAEKRGMEILERVGVANQEMITEVLDVMVGLAKDGMTMVVVTHEMGFARKAAARVLFMADGEIVEEGTPENFFTKTKTPRAKDFLSKILAH
jgi:glutamate transport system ATP-binding protein